MAFLKRNLLKNYYGLDFIQKSDFMHHHLKFWSLFRLPTACSCFLEPAHGYLARVRRSGNYLGNEELGPDLSHKLRRTSLTDSQTGLETGKRDEEEEEKIEKDEKDEKTEDIFSQVKAT